MKNAITVTAKVRLRTNPQQEEILLRTLHAYRDACNFVSNVVFENKSISRIELHKKLYGDLRSQFSLKSQMACSVFRTVTASYETIRSNQHPWHEVVYKHGFCAQVYNRDYSIRGDLLSINTIDGRIKVPFYKKGNEQYFDGSWTYGSATLLHKHNKWYLCISVSKEMEACASTCVVGVDLGINFLTASYDGNHSQFQSGRFVKQKRANYKLLRK